MCNQIQKLIDSKSREQKHPDLWRKEKKAQINNIIGSETKATRILRNSSQASVTEYMKIAEVLDLDVQDLLDPEYAAGL